MSEKQVPYEAVWPLGKSHWDKRDLNPGVGDLNGKTIAEVWDRVFRGEEIFPAIRKAIRKKYPVCASLSTTSSATRTASIRNRSSVCA